MTGTASVQANFFQIIFSHAFPQAIYSKLFIPSAFIAYLRDFHSSYLRQCRHEEA